MPAQIIVRRNVLHRGVAAAAAPAARSIITASTPKQYLTTTWGSNPLDATRVTISYWQKFIVVPAGVVYAFTTGQISATTFDHQFSNFTFNYGCVDDSSSAYSITGGGISPDNTTWHHVCVQIDTNQVTATNRVRIYIDGVEVAYATQTEPSLGGNMQALANGIASYIGEVWYNVGTSTSIPDAKFAYFYLIDGQALPPSSFTTGTGVGSIHPITYAGSFGTLGFFLNGANGSLADQGPNSIVWTAPNSISFSTDLPT